MTPNELVLEFGNFFPDRQGIAPPSDFKPDVRIVLNVGAVEAMAKSFAQLAEQRKGQQQVVPQTPMGFTPK